jgi:hypothetical protein
LIHEKVSKISYLELQELNGTTELPHGRISRLLNNEFIAIGSMDGSFMIYHANNLVSQINKPISILEPN